jgi:uncharacterized membrane protein YfcA
MDTGLIVLPLATFVTSALTGIVGMGGGLMLLLVMSAYLPFAVLIPVHGISQLVTHFGRATVSLVEIDYRLAARFAVGAMLGAAIGTQFVPSISEETFKLALGGFVLLCLIQPKLKFKFNFNTVYKWPFVGALTSFCGLFVGATGVLIAPFFLNEKLNKEQLVATKAACQVFIHSSKIVAFFVLGFALGPYLLLIVLMCLMSLIGSFLAKHALAKIPEKQFYILFQIVIVVMAAKLIYTGVKAIVST